MGSPDSRVNADKAAQALNIAGGASTITLVAVEEIVREAWGHTGIVVLAAIVVALFVAAQIIRIRANPTPTHDALVFDRSTGTTVAVRTVDPPSGVPAQAPVYANTPAAAVPQEKAKT